MGHLDRKRNTYCTAQVVQSQQSYKEFNIGMHRVMQSLRHVVRGICTFALLVPTFFVRCRDRYDPSCYTVSEYNQPLRQVKSELDNAIHDDETITSGGMAETTTALKECVLFARGFCTDWSSGVTLRA